MFLLLINNCYVLIKQDSLNISQHAMFQDRLFLMMGRWVFISPSSDDDAALLMGVNWTAVVSVLEFSRDKSSRVMRLSAQFGWRLGGFLGLGGWFGGEGDYSPRPAPLMADRTHKGTCPIPECPPASPWPEQHSWPAGGPPHGYLHTAPPHTHTNHSLVIPQQTLRSDARDFSQPLGWKVDGRHRGNQRSVKCIVGLAQ